MWLAYAILLVVSLYLLMPWQPEINHGLDYAWMLGLNVAHDQHLQFGSDIIFSYGPWGFAELGVFYPATRVLVFWVNGLLILGWTAGLWLVAGRWICRHAAWRALALAAVVMTVSASANPWFTLTFVMGLCMLMSPLKRLNVHRLFMHRDGSLEAMRRRRWQALGWLLLLVTAGFLSQMKITYAVAIAGVMTAVVLMSLVGQHRRTKAGAGLTIGVIYLLAWLMAWSLAGQSLHEIGNYLLQALDVITHYNQAMAIPGPTYELGWLLAALFAILLWGALTIIRGKADRLRQVVQLVALLALLFIVYKSGITRQARGQMLLASCTLLGMAVLLTTHEVGRFKREKSIALRWIRGCILMAALVSVIGLNVVLKNGPVAYGQALASSQRLTNVADFFVHGDKLLRHRWNALQQAVQAEIPLKPDALTSTAIYPGLLEVPIWAGMKTSFRPGLQSYAAYSENLLRRNARYLEGHDAPRRVLLAQEPMVDQRYPAQNDSLSWPWLLTRYDVVKQWPGYVLLHRNIKPRPMLMTPLKQMVITLGQTVQVPAIPSNARGLWVKMKIQSSRSGQLRGMLYKQPPVMMQVQYTDGSTGQFHMIPSIAQAGFLLSPAIGFDQRWILFATASQDDPRLQALRINLIRFVVLGPTASQNAYQPDIQLAFFAFSFEPQQP